MKSNSKKHSEVEIQVIMLTNAVLRQGIMHGMAFTGSGDTALTTQCHKHLKGDGLQGASIRKFDMVTTTSHTTVHCKHYISD